MFSEQLKLVTYNCRGLKLGSNCFYERLEVEQLLSDFDIVCLQETWLTKQQEGELKVMRKDINAIANSPNDDSLHITAGRKKEGVAILWNNKFDQFIVPHKYEYDWVVSIEILSDNKKMYIFNVYLPYDKLDNEEEYIDRLAKLHNILAECDSTCVAVVGDYNANVLKNANFAVLLKEYCSQFKYKWSSCLKLPEGTHTYVSDAWGSYSWLDHIISTEDGNNVITNMYVLYGTVQSDHIPLVAHIDLQLAPDIDQGATNNMGNKIDWSILSEDILCEYGVQSEILLSNVEIPTDVILCKDCNCNNVEHKEALNKYFDDIMFAITSAGQTTIKTRNRSNGKNLNRPGWKEFASELYDMSRETYALWKNEGSPRQGLLFEMKNRAKARFKGAMRFIRRNEDALRKESLAKKLLCKNDKAFWKEIKLMNNSNLSLPNVVDGITGSNNIVNMWKSHYEDLFNCLKKDKNVNDFCKTVDYEVDMEVSHSDIIQAIQDLKDSKSCGLDGIYAEHLKHWSNLIIPLLSMCFSSLFVHGCLPEAMISVVLVPIVKNKSASICSKSNYRPIALASIVSKVLEKLIYDRIAVYLNTCSNQFGFKAKHSTDMTIYALKEAVL